MALWTVCLAALAVLCRPSAAAPDCVCVDPVSCPEAIVDNPVGCRTEAGRPGVCCSAGPAVAGGAATAVAFDSPARRGAAAVAATAAFNAVIPRTPQFRRNLSFQLPKSGLPAAVSNFFNALPADSSADSTRAFGVRSFTTASTALCGAADGARAKLFSTRQPTCAAPASATTRLNTLNARTSAASQRRGAAALLVLLDSQPSEASPAPGFSFIDTGGGTSPAQAVPNCTPERPVRCSSTAKYRTSDGSCNNLRNTLWGRSLRGLRRIFDSTYDDGVFAPRSRSVFGGALPAARAVSVTALRSDSAPHRFYTMSLVTFGQFTDHDLSISPIFFRELSSGKLEAIECCGKDGGQLPADMKHPQCLPIAIAASDPHYGSHGKRCMNFVRSIPEIDPQCRPRPATQLNDLTGWLDLSQVYGSSDEKQHELRTFRNGLLKTSNGELLPREVPNPKTNCTTSICFIAGDERVNENTLLTLFHTVFMREHNRVARALVVRHRGWSEETLFQEARRLVVAEWQHILYSEWLPALLGYRFVRQVALTGAGPLTYVDHLDPTVSTEFSTAGFRLHSLVQGVIEMVTRIGSVRQRLQMTDNFFRPDSLVVSKLFVEMARGVTRQQSQSYDRRFVQAVHGDLFKVDVVGLDLMALNIQRGRDHAIPVYVTVAERCNRLRLGSWASLRQLMSAADVSMLRATYRHWRDVDLFVGLNMERPAAGAVVGPTTRCILADEFLRARYADRFFYDQAGQPGSFSPAQMRQIRKATWARLLCDNVGRGFDAVQPLAFIKPITFFQLNPVVSCNSPRIQKVNLRLF